MIKNKVPLMLALIAVLLLGLLTSCGVSPEEYDRINAEIKASQEQVATLQTELGASQAQVTDLQGQIIELRAKSELVGETPTDTAVNIVKRYHETHSYNIYDFFVCADMSLDVWNMLEAQGIDALIQIGNVHEAVANMEESSHAWVLAEISPGHYLALETTNGLAVLEKENPLYYRGWSFDNPREYKRFEELKYEHNIRVSIMNKLIDKHQETYGEYQKEYSYYQELVDEFNGKYAGQPFSEESQMLDDEIEAQSAIAKKFEGRYNQLDELIIDQQQELENIVPQMQRLTN
ncbi:hypothetical protein ACFLUF_00940 [Chloroflexota bacterium]